MQPETSASVSIEADLQQIRGYIRESLDRTSLREVTSLFGSIIDGGKMLRSRLTLRIGGAAGVPRTALVRAGAVVEMMHAASLLHDDIVDGGTLRRGEPALWVSEGARAAVLLGDLLVSLAAETILETLPEQMPVMIATLREMCDSEAEQEFSKADSAAAPSWEHCVSIARRKTGSLFGFAASCAGGPRPGCAQALRRAGYALGTAYQLADDLLDASPEPLLTDKTLGTDAATGKLTAATAAPEDGSDPVAHIGALLRESEAELAAWPAVQQAWRAYVGDVVAPVVARFAGLKGVEVVA